MDVKIEQSWKDALAGEFEKPYFASLVRFLREEKAAGKKIFPPGGQIFHAFELTPVSQLKVVILGQDPYHGAGEANGLCFSVNDNIKIPPSLRNILREINTDLDSVFMPLSGNLKNWADQGVLLLNASLTVRKDTPNSHKHLKWNLFTDAVIQIISEKKETIVFLLSGSSAQKKGIKIDRSKH